MLGVFVLGFRHGFDVDHVAAIGDIGGSQPFRWRALLLCELYAVGHALTVLVLALAVEWSSLRLPDPARLVGLTLVLLGGVVLWRASRGQPVESRATMLRRGLLRARHALRPVEDVEHDHPHDHEGRGHDHEHADPTATRPSPVLVGHRHRHVHRVPAPYSVAGAVAVGLVHGLGAETATQVVAVSGGTSSLLPFLSGLFLANSAAALGVVTFLTAARLRVLNALVGLFSLAVGAAYLVGLEPGW